MDTLAAFALATEPPLDSVLAGEPFKEDSSILTPVIWRQVLGISIWNVVVMVLVILLVPPLAGLEYEFTASPLLPDVVNADGSIERNHKRVHMTYIFNTFVFLQLFNEVNCRKIGRRDFNVLESIFGNHHFLAVVLGTLAF
jgi:magnesium-transporting ATPase (P-type)